jgi:prepilin peptidase CpaA
VIVMDMMRLAPAHVIALAVAAIACVWDLRCRRIPNVLTLGAAVAAVGFHAVVGGIDGGVTSAAGWLVGVALLFLPFALGGMGGGDVKLLGALGAWVGPADAVWLALYTGVAGGVLAILIAAMRGYLAQAVGNIWSLLMFWRVMGLKPMPSLTLHSGRAPRMAYAAPILAGTVVTLWLH